MKLMFKKSDKGFKTTVVALTSLSLIILSFVALFLKVLTGDELSTLITGITAGSVVILGLFTKDSDKTGTDADNDCKDDK